MPGLAALARFAHAFPADYRDAYPPAVAAADDVSRLMEIEAGSRPDHRPAPAARCPAGGGPVHADASGRAAGAVRGAAPARGPRRHRRGRAAARDPRRRSERVAVRHRAAGGDPERIDERAVRDEFCATFAALFRGTLESDGLNELVLVGGLTARQVDVLRAYAKYLRQVGLSFSQTLRRGHARSSRLDRGRADPPVRGPLRSRPRRPSDAAQADSPIGPGDGRPGGHHGLDHDAARRRAQPRRGPHPALVPDPHRGDPADQRLPAGCAMATPPPGPARCSPSSSTRR